MDPKKSMNVNIFLKQFRKTNDVIIELIKQGDARSLGVEKLKGLLKILPQQDEVILRDFFLIMSHKIIAFLIGEHVSLENGHFKFQVIYSLY